MLTGRKPHSKPLARAALTVASFVLAVFVCLGLRHAALAQGVSSNELLPGQFGNAIGLTTTDIRVTIANIIRIICLILLTYFFGDAVGQGFLHVTAGLFLFAISLLIMFAIDNLVSRFWPSAKKVAA